MYPESKKGHIFFIFGLVIVSILVLSGCIPECSPYNIENKPAPIPLEPISYEITNGDPTFRWDYDISIHQCSHSYTVIYSVDPGFNTTSTLSCSSLDKEINQTLGLDPGRQYWWKVAAKAGDGTVGPYSEVMSFVVGPECNNSSELEMPIQLYPFDGSIVDNALPVFAYETPGDCALKYWIDLQTSPEFGGGNLLNSTTPFISTRVSLAPANALADCTTYYWRVWTTINGVDGPYSPTWSFTTDFTGSCGSPSSTAIPTDSPTQISYPTLTPTHIPLPTNTPVPTPTDVNCSIYSDEKSCELHSGCVWDTSTRVGSCQNK